MLNHQVTLFELGENSVVNYEQKCSFKFLHHYTTSTKVNKKHTVQLPTGRETPKMSIYANESGKEENVNLFPALNIKQRNNLSSFSAEYEKVPQT